jgi:glutamate-1-semialdehyde 2,1-aminomutase
LGNSGSRKTRIDLGHKAQSRTGHSRPTIDFDNGKEKSMEKRDHTKLLAELADAYTRHSPRSAALNEEAKKHLVDGGSHALRLIEPFPPRIVAAKGAWVQDEDGHGILDFWQGHLGNILGHNPEIVTSALSQALEQGFGLQTGFTDRLQVEVAEIVCQQTGSERVRFTTSGALSTMYACLLARAYTGRDLVMKVGGGWHGAQPWGLKGVGYHANNDNGYQHVESAGLPAALTDDVVITRYNDPEMLHDHFEAFGDRLACFMVEPFIGAGGLMPATHAYLTAARELTEKHGTVLIFDEVISGFRFRPGNLGALYGVQPDLSTFGKIIGGGMPVAAVAGRAEIMRLVGREGGSKVKFSGGTYSAHPASLLAAKTMLTYLVENKDAVYPRLARLGELARETLEAAFIDEGIFARCTGYGNDVVPGTSMAILHFPYDESASLDSPESVFDPSVCDVTLSHKVVELALLLEDVHFLEGHGAVTTAHTEVDMEFLSDACRRVARRIKPCL